MNWFDANAIITGLGTFAVVGIAVIIFFETATILGSFLPGDSLLFLLGLTLATAHSSFPLWLAVLLVLVAAFAGSETGFWLGHRIGPRIFQRRPTFFFNPRVLTRARSFFETYGARAVILARFVPVLRALIPMFAGMTGFPPRRYVALNFIGAFAWVVGLMLAGFLLGQLTFVREHIELCVISFVIASSLPLPLELLRARLKRNA
ncbi:MAG: DedA family protein [Actinomycetales bacterium]|nr:DedA family protein [Actinomycetales bacterium]